MEILPEIELIDYTLLIKKKILVIADLHIGYESALNEQGILIPRHQFKETEKRLEELFKKINKVETIVINGDLKHEFGKISEQEWHETLGIIDYLNKKCKKIILLKGNHDTILEPIAKKRKVSVKNFYCVDNICIFHGDKILIDDEVNKAKIFIIGHEHPAISIREGSKSELYKCFLLGRWKNKKLIVQPSFLPIVEGTDVKREKLLSPYLKDVSNFKAFIVADKIYEMGQVRNI